MERQGVSQCWGERDVVTAALRRACGRRRQSPRANNPCEPAGSRWDDSWCGLKKKIEVFWKLNFLLACFSVQWLKYWHVFLSLEHSNPPLLPPPPDQWKPQKLPLRTGTLLLGLDLGSPVGVDDGAHAEPSNKAVNLLVLPHHPQREAKNSRQSYRVLGKNKVRIKHGAGQLESSTLSCKMEHNVYQGTCRTV